MKKLILTAVSTFALLSGPVLADSVGTDAGIRVVGYSALHRVDIVGIIGQPTVITFPTGEQVYRVIQSGLASKDGVDDTGWQGPKPANKDEASLPLENNLMLWPARVGTSTMSVITKTATGVQKVYPFRMIAKPADWTPDASVTLNLIFKGTASDTPVATAAPSAKPFAVGMPTPSPAAIAAWQARQKEKADAKVQLARAEAFEPLPGQACSFDAHGKILNAITPKCPLTDGQWTIFRFPGLSKKPAIYIGSCEDGHDEERLARQHESGDFVVVEEIAPRFCLRLGPDVLDIINKDYDPVGKPAPGGTVNPGVKRDLVKATVH